MFDRRSELLSKLTLLQDLGVTCVAFSAAHWLRPLLVRDPFFSQHLRPAIYPLRHYVPAMLSFLAVWVVVSYVFRLDRDLYMDNSIGLILKLASQVVIVLAIFDAGLYLFKGADISRSYVLLIGVVDFVLVLAGRMVSYSSVVWMRERLRRYHYFLIVGDGLRAREMALLIEAGYGMGLRLIGFVDPDSEGSRLGEKFDGYEVFPPSAMEQVLHDRVVDEVIFAVDMQTIARLEPVLSHCAKVGARVRVHLEFLPEAYSRIYLETFRRIPFLRLSSTPERERLLLKRVLDAGLAGLMLVLLFPLLAVIAVAIRITSPGELLFRQTRCGLGGRRFVLYKFRSMLSSAGQASAVLHRPGELDGPAFNPGDDPRITSVGRLLRRLNLDELPQLWNILRGDMSFVGPRPAIPEEVEKYETWQRRRLRMRPGMTCVWALEGRSRVDLNHRMALDLSYIDNWSPWFDFVVLFRTIPILLSGRGAH